jgi:predicted acylesterase/phospholipase RssA
MNEKPDFDTICMSGGGVKGFSFLGVLDYLEFNSYIDTSKISNWVGTSAGSVLSFLFTLGYTVHEIGDFVLAFNFNKIQPEPSIDSLLTEFGMDDGSKIILILIGFLKEKYDIEDVTFEELFKLTNKKLIIIGTNFSKGTEVVFNHENTPSMSVLTAIRISFSIPFVFTPVLYDSDYWIDGAFVNNFPIKYCNPKTTFGIYIKNCINNDLTNIFSLINGCLAIIADTISKKDWTDVYPYIMEIDNFMADFINFNLERDKKLKIINLGQIYAKKYLEQTIKHPPTVLESTEQIRKEQSIQTDKMNELQPQLKLIDRCTQTGDENLDEQNNQEKSTEKTNIVEMVNKIDESNTPNLIEQLKEFEKSINNANQICESN